MGAKRAEQRLSGCSVKIPFRTKGEQARFVKACSDNEQSQGGFARLAILEKLDREELVRGPA